MGLASAPPRFLLHRSGAGARSHASAHEEPQQRSSAPEAIGTSACERTGFATAGLSTSPASVDMSDSCGARRGFRPRRAQATCYGVIIHPYFTAPGGDLQLLAELQTHLFARGSRYSARTER